MKLMTGLFRFARKRAMTTDNDLGAFRSSIEELVEKKDGLSDEEVSAKVDELKALSADLPESEDKAKLDRFLDDFKAIKEQDESTAKEAAKLVADLFEKLDTAAMQDVPVVETETATEEAPETTETATKSVEETVAPETAETTEETSETDDDGEEKPFDEYTLEEIYQFVKKRMGEDATADSGEEVETEEEKEEEVVTDHAPFIPVTMNAKAAAGSLEEMFANIKKGGR